ncbi:MAG: hypothetical protein A2X49_00220 [Lentisphaerae bacterium GWF2_52_8]|nr:MAG: hypothetical protein A2X49_00220 [Lentisphaerae bacterium GWF2_52_8]
MVRRAAPVGGVKALAGVMLEKGLTLSVAESCTGGLIAKKITDLPGSSGYFAGGVVAYSNRAKINILGIPPSVIGKYGAVSGRTASLMARRARELFGTDLGCGVTGIAGPGGGTEAKPAGLIYYAVSKRGGTTVTKLLLKGSRASIRKKASDMVLASLLATAEKQGKRKK